MPADELAGRKVLALFDRAATHDFVDVYQLAQIFNKQDLLTRASEIDLGFDVEVFAQMMQAHQRFEDEEFYSDKQQVLAIRTFFDEWIVELSA